MNHVRASCDPQVSSVAPRRHLGASFLLECQGQRLACSHIVCLAAAQVGLYLFLLCQLADLEGLGRLEGLLRFFKVRG